MADFGKPTFSCFDRHRANRLWPNFLLQCFGQIFSTHKTQTPKPKRPPTVWRLVVGFSFSQQKLLMPLTRHLHDRVRGATNSSLSNTVDV